VGRIFCSFNVSALLQIEFSFFLTFYYFHPWGGGEDAIGAAREAVSAAVDLAAVVVVYRENGRGKLGNDEGRMKESFI
jgi:hypothetical protein